MKGKTMTRQSSTPVPYEVSMRPDRDVKMTSGRAGDVRMLGYIPLLPGESMSGQVGIDIKLAEMPRPLINAVYMRVQAWCVPKLAFPQFPGRDELNHAMTGDPIKSLGAADRAPPAYFTTISGAAVATAAASDMFKTLGLHIPAGAVINTDLIDAFVLVYNFRLAAHSSRLPRRQYAAENIAQATSFPPAFWPSGRFSHVVPDYEAALVQGTLDLDVLAGRLPVRGIGIGTNGSIGSQTPIWSDGNGSAVTKRARGGADVFFEYPGTSTKPEVYADMALQSIGVTLMDIDKARIVQAYAKLHAAYAGNDSTGFNNDETLTALLMQGIDPGQEAFKRPWLLDDKRVPVGFSERFATDAANLDASVSEGRASATLSLNTPKLDAGGVVIYTIEVLPDRIDERQSDEWLYCANFNALPNPLRDITRTLPVDMVLNRRLDAKHTAPNGLYGYEPMNSVWKRDFTRMGGIFYQATPGAQVTESRAGLWQTDIIDPTFTATHHLAPSPFPHDVFADATQPAFEVTSRHVATIVGNVQFGDVLTENNDDYEAVETSGQ